MAQHLSAQMLSDPGHFLALGFGSGLAPVAPGTWGTLVGIGCYLLLLQLGSFYWAASMFLFVIGIPLCARTAQALGVHDHPAIVWDEIVGYLLTMSFVEPTWQNIVCGFVLFRLFDIWKPWPIRILDARVSGGFGIMLDDLVAALFAIFGLEIIKYISYS